MSSQQRKPFDVDLDDWVNRAAYHPANTRLKQMGHELARKAVVALGQLLHWLLPPGQSKSLAFTHLNLVRLYANEALATGGGPDPERHDEQHLEAALAGFRHVTMPEDQRIAEVKEAQLQERESAVPSAPEDAPRLGLTGAAVVRADEPTIHAEQDTAPPETFRAEELSDDPADIDLVVVGGRGYVQVASLARTVERKREALGADLAAFAQDMPDGFYACMSTPTQVNEFLSAVAAAGDRAFTG